MPDKDLGPWLIVVEHVKQAGPYVYTIFLSTWGGIVNYVTRVRQGGTKFNLRDLVYDLVVSTFAGLLTYMLCEASNVSGPTSAILIAISGHMGTRAIAGFEELYNRVVGGKRVN